MTFTFLENLIQQKRADIQKWLQNKQSHIQLPLFTSIDIRNAGFKVAHVDANLFPAGFNNLSPHGEKQAVLGIKEYLNQYFSTAKKILLIPENFTRNLKYLENLSRLKGIIKKAGFEVIIGSPYNDGIVKLDHPKYFEVLPLRRQDDLIMTSNNWVPDIIVLNNDLTTGLPEILQNCQQPILPHPKLGWFQRRKHQHFLAYNIIAQDFAEHFNFDPWLISTYFENCGTIDFRHKQGLECLAQSVDAIIAKIRLKYSYYGIKAEPYVFIKADMGTYGLGVMTARSSEDVLHINKKHRHSMQVIKHGVHNTEILIQEGVPTTEEHEGFPSESLIYMIAGKVIGNIMRWNKEHDKHSNLNAHGMVLTASDIEHYGIKSVISELAALAVTKESL